MVINRGWDMPDPHGSAGHTHRVITLETSHGPPCTPAEPLQNPRKDPQWQTPRRASRRLCPSDHHVREVLGGTGSMSAPSCELRRSPAKSGKVGQSLANLDGRNRARVIAESLARVVTAIRINSARWRSNLPLKTQNLVLVDPAFAALRLESRDWRSLV